jgi:hypothetical protein
MFLMQMDRSRRTVTCKVGYFGPGLSGKRSNLERLYDALPASERGEQRRGIHLGGLMHAIDIWPSTVEIVPGHETRFHVCAHSGSDYEPKLITALVAGVDAVVFVADSQRERKDADIESLERFLRVFEDHGIEFATLPYVLQLNKRDVRGVMPVDEMKADLVRKGEPVIEAIAVDGVGVLETFQALIEQLRRVDRDGA